MTRLALAFLIAVVGSRVALAGPYAELAAQVQANGGLLQVWATGGLQIQNTATLATIAAGLCHTVAREGVQTTQIQFLTPSGTVVLVVGAAQLKGC